MKPEDVVVGVHSVQLRDGAVHPIIAVTSIIIPGDDDEGQLLTVPAVIASLYNNDRRGDELLVFAYREHGWRVDGSPYNPSAEIVSSESVWEMKNGHRETVFRNSKNPLQRITVTCSAGAEAPKLRLVNAAADALNNKGKEA